MNDPWQFTSQANILSTYTNVLKIVYMRVYHNTHNFETQHVTATCKFSIAHQEKTNNILQK